MTTTTQEGTAVPVRRIDLLQDWWHSQGRYSRDLTPEARRALAGWDGVTDDHVNLLATALRQDNTVERELRAAMRGMVRTGVCWRAVDILRDGPKNTRQVAMRLGVTMDSALKIANRLRIRGVITMTSTGPTTPALWELTIGGGDECD